MNGFLEFPKIPRLNREIIITEKIDGTNAQVYVWDRERWIPNPNKLLKNLVPAGEPPAEMLGWIYDDGRYLIAAGSRNRWLTTMDDNFGFARWVMDNAKELTLLGHGRHYGEWWGSGIQRGYDMPKGVKCFSLFNVSRWVPPHQGVGDTTVLEEGQFHAPACCSVVPTFYRGLFNTDAINGILWELKNYGSKAKFGFMDPEGIVIFHTAANHSFKVTLKDDSEPKSKKCKPTM